MEKNTKNFLLIGGILAAAGVAAYFIFGNNGKKTTVAAPTDSASTDTTSTATTTTAPKTDAPVIPPVESLCYTRKPETVGYFTMKWKQELDDWVNSQRLKGYSNDYISHVAAFLKGMDAALNTDNPLIYAKEIKAFVKAKPKLKRNADFATEILNQVYNTGDLVCEEVTTDPLVRFVRQSRMYLPKANKRTPPPAYPTTTTTTVQPSTIPSRPTIWGNN